MLNDVTRARAICEALATYQIINGGRYVVHVLPEDHPLPAPQINDHTIMQKNVMVIIPDGGTDNELGNRQDQASA